MNLTLLSVIWLREVGEPLVGFVVAVVLLASGLDYWSLAIGVAAGALGLCIVRGRVFPVCARDRSRLEPSSRLRRVLLVIADKGFAGAEFEAWMADRGATFLRPDRKDEVRRYGSLGRVRHAKSRSQPQSQWGDIFHNAASQLDCGATNRTG